MSLTEDHITKLTKGDLKAFREMHDDMYHSLCLYGYRIISDKDLVADVVQEAFIILWKKKEEFTSLIGTRSYLYAIVRNKLIDHLRKDHFVSIDVDLTKEVVFDNQISKEETYKLVREAVAKLPKQTRKVVELTINGNSNLEIANILGVSINTVKTLKKKGYAKLREMLKDNIYVLFFLSEIFQL